MAGKKNQEPRKKTTEELVLLTNALEMTADIVIITDLQGKILDINDAARKYYRVQDKEEIIGTQVFEGIAPELRKKANAFLKILLKEGEVKTDEFYSTLHGGQVYFDASATVIKDLEDKKIGIVLILRDVTERKIMEKKWQSIADNAPDTVIILDLKSRISYINRVVSGLEEEEVIGKSQYDYIAPEYHDIVKKTINSVIKTGKPGSYSIQGVGPDGRISWYNTKVGPLIEGDDINGVILFSTDITDHREDEEALKASEEKWRSLVENAPNIIVIVNQEGIVQFINRTITKTSTEEIIGTSIFDYVEPEFYDVMKKAIDKVFKTGKSSRYTSKATDLGDSVRWFENQVGAIKQDGEVVAVTLIVNDITEEKLVEEALRESEVKYRSLFEFSPDAIALLSLDGKVLECNDATTRILGLPKRKLLGKSFMDLGLIFEEDLSKYMKKFSQALKEKGESSFQVKINRGDGNISWIEAFPIALKIEGEANAFQVIIHDITERKKTETEMRKRLLKFDLEEGNTYLVKEVRSSQSLAAFKELLEIGYSGQIITRSPATNYIAEVGRFFEYTWLSEKGKENVLPPKIKEIEKFISGLAHGQAILIDGVEYLISKIGFGKTLSAIQSIRETAYLKDHVIILSIDPATVGEKELRLMEKETVGIAAQMALGKMPVNLLDILKFVNEENSLGVEPSYSDVGVELELSKPTARKRIRKLVSMGCLKEQSKGRSKYLDITEKGKSYMVLK